MVEPCRVIKDDVDIALRLADFGVRPEDVLRIALAARAARNDSIPFDPKTGKGLLGYIYGVRELRNVFVLTAGYQLVSKNNIEAVYHPVKGRKIMFQAADCACIESQSPKAVSAIGVGKEALIARSVGYLFPEMEAEDRRLEQEFNDFDRAEAWYVIVAFSDDGEERVSCELSRPGPPVNGQFERFVERIFISGGGGPDAGALLKLDDDTPPVDIRPTISKK